jgi:hypothetical protein
MIINITPAGVIESTLMYGIVHGVWLLLKKIARAGYKELRAERDRIIHNHVKAGHEGRLKHCIDEACISLRMPARESVQEVPAPHIES